jgi:exonuclease SbcC
MKILHTADWHLGAYRGPVKDGINLRSEDIKRCLDELVRVAGIEKPDYTLISGDIFNVGKLWSDRCCNEIITAFHYIKELSMASKHVIVMRGTPNHDGAGQFKVLEEMFAEKSNVHIVTDPKVFSFDDANIVVLPGPDKGRYRAQATGLSKDEENLSITNDLANMVIGLKELCDPTKKSILMAHYTVPGCDAESGQVMMRTQFEPVLTQEALIAADFDLVALGHIHKPQRLLSRNWFYSGAINAFNFNDEGQERGFWIHNELPSGWDSNFHKTPIREFKTIKLSDEDISLLNAGGIDMVAATKWRGEIDGKIVRIRYSCTSGNAKAYKMNEAMLEKKLLDDGAFMLFDNLPEKIDEFTNKKELESSTDPEINLIQYLREKETPEEKIQELVEKARPVISEAEASMTTAANTGVFEPVEISVKNYRNYEEETFNFEDISFCTINGQNGAGKSSLFMDAIIDCLYEEPREGMLKDGKQKPVWLREVETARSGSIIFTFRIGERTFRVTRTRTRSGSGTLNLSEMVDGEWEDRSKEKMADTQSEILDTIGMDSFTFKSCALIMQDQYGLFLQAKPEERTEVLGTLLGLGVYQSMEKIAAEKARVNGAKARELAQNIDLHLKTIDGIGHPEDDMERTSAEIATFEAALTVKQAERDKNKLILTHHQEARERREKALNVVSELKAKKERANSNLLTQKAIFDSAGRILDEKAEIEAKVAEYAYLQEKESALAGEAALYNSKKRESESLTGQINAELKKIDELKAQLERKTEEAERCLPTEHDEEIIKGAEEYEEVKKQLDEAYEKERAYRQIEQSLSEAKRKLEYLKVEFDNKVYSLKAEEARFQKEAEMLEGVNCVDVDNAKCEFLKSAIAAKETCKMYPKYYKKAEQNYEDDKKPIEADIEAIGEKLKAIDYDAEVLRKLTEKANELRHFVPESKEITQKKTLLALAESDMNHLTENLEEAEKRHSELEGRTAEVYSEVERYSKAFTEHAKIQGDMYILKPWLDKEKQLPVAEERYTTASGRIVELTVEIQQIEKEIVAKEAEADKEAGAMEGIAEVSSKVDALDAEVFALSDKVKSLQMALGALKQKTEQIEGLKKEIEDLQRRQNEFAKETSDFEALKVAFSQSGVPHQIIRSIIPQLTATANSILGQMTGGKMGVEFRLERLQRNGKEKAALDIFINEYGKGTLPYLSKSGGEKVKSSLSVILALAEIKSSSAGIQLGMLFIDEPPFLDGDGIQAYCDSLETIQARYKNIKIMAITHDPTMKARFPQSLDVVKTENGSKVIY